MNGLKQFLNLDKQIKCLKIKKITFNQIIEEEAKEFLFIHGYLNVATPDIIKRDEKHNPILDNNGNHVYKKEIDFIFLNVIVTDSSDKLL